MIEQKAEENAVTAMDHAFMEKLENDRCTFLINIHDKRKYRNMREYEVVKIGNRHAIKGELFSQDIIEIYPLDEFKYNQFFADQIYTFINLIFVFF